MRLSNLFLLLLLVASQTADATSFDCSKATGRTEKTICSSPQLLLLNDDLASAYKMAISSSKDPDQIRKSQQNWLRTERDSCTTRSCLVSVFKARIVALVPDFYGSAGYDPCGHESCENYAEANGLSRKQARQLAREAGDIGAGNGERPTQARNVSPAARALREFYSYHPLQLETTWIHGVVVAEGNSAGGYRIRMFSNNPPVEVSPYHVGPNVCPSGTARATEDTRSRPPGYVTFGCWAPTQSGELVVLWEPYDKNHAQHFLVRVYDPSTFYMNADLALDLQRFQMHR